MATAFDGLPRASFAGIEYPILNQTVRGGVRDKIHEYPHADGGAPEKLGRRLYTIKQTASFKDVYKNYGNLWPDKLRQLLLLCESSTTDKLVVPTVGALQVYAKNWTRNVDFKIRSGEIVELEWQEDGSDALSLNSAIFLSNGVASIAQLANAIYVPVDVNAVDTSWFAELNRAVNAVQQIKDQANLAGRILESRIQYAMGVCNTIDGLTSMQTAGHAQVVDQVHALWAALQQFGADIKSKALVQQTFNVPVQMSISDVAAQLFGDTSRAMEILQMNPINDAFAIPAGTKLQYYAAA